MIVRSSIVESLQRLSEKNGVDQVQRIFNEIITDLTEYLDIFPLYNDYIVKMAAKDNFIEQEQTSILDFGVIRTFKNKSLYIKISEHYDEFLPFILVREAYYMFVDKHASQVVKICINQIVENELNKVSGFRKWKKLIRDAVVDKTFLSFELDRLQKFFKTEAQAPFETVTQFFFKEIRENILLCQDDNIERFYDIIFEAYTHKTSRSLFNSEIMETLRVLTSIFYETKSYLSVNDYQTLFKDYKEKLQSELSVRKFTENLQWINKCTSIAPSYDFSYTVIGLYPVMATIKFNPLLEKAHIKKVLEKWSFFYLSKIAVDSFALDLFISFHVPKVYLKDFLNYFKRLEEDGYIIQQKFYSILDKTDFINLNYYIDNANMNKIIDPYKYDHKNELECYIEFPRGSPPASLSLFDYIMLDRVRSVSVTGLTFDKRIETLNAIKDDVKNEIRHQETITTNFKKSLEKVLQYPKVKYRFLEFLVINKNHGFLYAYSQLDQIIRYLTLLEEVLSKNPEITTIHQLQVFLNSQLDSQIIEERILLHNEELRKIITHDFLSVYFQSKESFREEVEKVHAFYDILDACYNLKILDIMVVKQIVEEPHLAEEICRTREKRYNEIFKAVSLYKITNEKIESTIEAFLAHDPLILKPHLINTIFITTFAKYYPEVLLKDTFEVQEKLKKLRLYFPKMIIRKTTELFTNKNLLRVLIYSTNIKEKQLLVSVFYSYFTNSIISFNRYFWKGLMRQVKFEARDFYNFEKGEFFYSKDLYKQLLIYSQKILGDTLSTPKYRQDNKSQFWSDGKDMSDLVDSIKNRQLQQDIDFNLQDLDDLIAFRKTVEYYLMDRERFILIRSSNFFERYIKTLRFIPAFQKFGFSQYHLFIRPLNTAEIDFKLLLLNTFQKIEYPTCIEANPGMYIRYLFPFKTPNKSYLNRLTKSKKVISEYCLFHKKKLYEIIQFNRNVSKEGWNYSSIRFKHYMQNVLFNPRYTPKLSDVREFGLGTSDESDIFGQDTHEFETLSTLYTTHSIDLKSILGTRHHTKIKAIQDLIKKNLIFPYLSLKNLAFQDKITLILPDITQEVTEKLITIFSFFNRCHIYEIEGEFYIYGFNKEKSFENGLCVEIWFPNCELDEFLEVFDLLFQYIKVKHYLILTDLAEGETLLTSVYGSMDFLKSYNPLSNLIWNVKDKKWRNHKLFNEKMEKLYPDLFYTK